MKNPSSGRGTTGSAAADIPSARRLAPLSFRIVLLKKYETPQRGARVVFGVVEIESCGSLSFEIVAPPGLSVFVAPKAIFSQDANGRWRTEHVFEFEPEFAEALLELAMQRLGAENGE